MAISRLLRAEASHSRHRWCLGARSVQTAAITPGEPKTDFAHHSVRMARLNNGSFGACPKPVMQYWRAQQDAWLAEPDTWYFAGLLDDALWKATQAAGRCLGTSTQVSPKQLCLVENATVAFAAIAGRWAKVVQPQDVIVVLSIGYGSIPNTLEEFCVRAGARVEVVEVPFPCASHAEVVDIFERQVKNLAASGAQIRFAVIDHISSQPALKLPAKEMVEICRRYGTADVEVAVDGSHSVGSCSFNVEEFGADWFYTNFHKWAFAPPTATLVWAASAKMMQETCHPIPSWHWGKGLPVESLFPGTRDFSAPLAVPAAVEYLNSWRSDKNETSAEFCHRRVLKSAKELADAWGTGGELAPPELVSTQAMVRLPPTLKVDDVPGRPGLGVRASLRDRYCVEAAIGNFGNTVGAWVRLSYAVYNTQRDIDRLKNGVLELLELQELTAR